LLNRGIFSIV